MSWFKDLFGGKSAPGSAPGDAPKDAPPPAADPAVAQQDADFVATAQARDRYWAKVGASESDFLTYLISPQLMGGSSWPTTRQAYRVVRTAGSTILSTDGLSDPFDDVEGAGNGLEMELYLETCDLAPEVAGAPGVVDPLKASWAFVVLQQVAILVADAGGVTGQLKRYGVLSVELPGIGDSPEVAAQVPARYLVGDGTLGLLLGMKAQGRADEITDAPLSSIRMVAVTVLTGEELDQVRTGGGAARMTIAEQMQAAPDGHFSDLKRPSLV